MTDLYTPKILPICQHGHPALKKVCMTVQDTIENKNSLADLLFTSLSIKSAIGLAANQTGMMLRAFVCLIDEQSKLVINPVIKKGRNAYMSKESCLSLPHLSVAVERFELLDIEYLDENFRKQRRKLKGLSSACYQHEMNHIDGITIVDSLSEVEKEGIKEHLSKIENGSIPVLYSIQLADGTVILPAPPTKPEPFQPSKLINEAVEKVYPYTKFLEYTHNTNPYRKS